MAHNVAGYKGYENKFIEESFNIFLLAGKYLCVLWLKSCAASEYVPRTGHTGC
jgi:hypothetical protein